MQVFKIPVPLLTKAKYCPHTRLVAGIACRYPWRRVFLTSLRVHARVCVPYIFYNYFTLSIYKINLNKLQTYNIIKQFPYYNITQINIYLSFFPRPSLSLSLSLYIYIYIYIHTDSNPIYHDFAKMHVVLHISNRLRKCQQIDWCVMYP